jgi:hypothetical protein
MLTLEAKQTRSNNHLEQKEPFAGAAKKRLAREGY